MTKLELAERWKASIRTVDVLCQSGKLIGRKVENSYGAKNLLDFSIDEIKKYEEDHNIPTDIMRADEVAKILNIDRRALFSLVKAKIFNVGYLTEINYVFSEREVIEFVDFIHQRTA